MDSKVWELISDPTKLANSKGFRVGKGKVVWKKVHMDTTKDRKRIRVERKADGQVVRAYLDPETIVTLIPK
jgi:hypothetical protein